MEHILGTDFSEFHAQAAQLKGDLERVREEKTSLQVAVGLFSFFSRSLLHFSRSLLPL
jgi:hypothetical protein